MRSSYFRLLTALVCVSLPLLVLLSLADSLPGWLWISLFFLPMLQVHSLRPCSVILEFPRLSPEPHNLPSLWDLLCRMLALSVSGLDPTSALASSWHLLLLGAASWLVARILAWTYSFCENCSRLRCFPESPRRNWFLGHLGLVSIAADRTGALGGCAP